MRPADHASRFRAEFRHREIRFLALRARRAAIVAHLPRWLHWVLPLPTRARSALLCGDVAANCHFRHRADGGDEVDEVGARTQPGLRNTNYRNAPAGGFEPRLRVETIRR